MKLLLDENLSFNLVGRLLDTYPESAHVSMLGLATATDQDIWAYAKEHGYTIVSKDSDFRQLAFMYGPPPKVVWVRVGNISTGGVLQVLHEYQQAMEAFGESEDEALLVLQGIPEWVRRCRSEGCLGLRPGSWAIALSCVAAGFFCGGPHPAEGAAMWIPGGACDASRRLALRGRLLESGRPRTARLRAGRRSPAWRRSP